MVKRWRRQEGEKQEKRELRLLRQPENDSNLVASRAVRLGVPLRNHQGRNSFSAFGNLIRFIIIN